MSKTYSCQLEYSTLLKLDGNCDEETQKIIDKAKEEHEIGLDDISNEIINQSLKLGTFRWTNIRIRECKACNNKPWGYHEYVRNSRGHYKGEKNYNNPIYYYGVQPNPGMVIVEGGTGICYDCWKNIYLPKILNCIIDRDLPVEIQPNDIFSTRYVKDEIRFCPKCSRDVFKSELKLEYGLFGTFPSLCPGCGSRWINMKDKGKFKMIKLEVEDDQS